VPPLGVKGEKLVMAVPTVRLCAVVVDVALIEVVEVVPLPPPPEHAVSNSTVKGSALRIKVARVWMLTEKLSLKFMLFPYS
jgi:hypothetical protein